MKSKNWAKILGVVAVLAVTGAIAWAGEYISKEEYTQGTWRYKITVEVETPEGIKTGSAVRQVTVTLGYLPSPESTADKDSKGEAVVVDLGKRGVLFSLTSFSDYYTVFRAFPFSQGGTTKEGIEYYSHLKDVKATLKPENYPMLVTFKNLNDPKSVVNVYEITNCEQRGKKNFCKEGQSFLLQVLTHRSNWNSIKI